MTKVLIIAEIGVNHNGDMVLAKEMIAAAANCNVDVIKFQTAIPELVQIDNAPKAKYQTKFTGDATSAMEMTRSFHFKHDAFFEIKTEVEKYNCEFLSTAFDMNSLEFLHSLNHLLLTFWIILVTEIQKVFIMLLMILHIKI